MGKSNEKTRTVTTTAPHGKESYVEPLLTKHEALRDPFGNFKSGDKDIGEKIKLEKDVKDVKEGF